MATRRNGSVLAALALVATLGAGCWKGISTPGSDPNAKPCVTELDCDAGYGCVDGVCASGAAFSLTVVLAGTGSGIVVSAPAGISCGINCSKSFLATTAVSLTAIPDANVSFVGWGGACAASPCVVAMNANATVTATFDAGATAAKEVVNVVTGAGRMTSGTFALDVQVGGGLGPESTVSGTQKLEAGGAAHPAQQR